MTVRAVVAAAMSGPLPAATPSPMTAPSTKPFWMTSQAVPTPKVTPKAKDARATRRLLANTKVEKPASPRAPKPWSVVVAEPTHWNSGGRNPDAASGRRAAQAAPTIAGRNSSSVAATSSRQRAVTSLQ